MTGDQGRRRREEQERRWREDQGRRRRGDRGVAEILASFQIQNLMDDLKLISKIYAVARPSPRLYCRELSLLLIFVFAKFARRSQFTHINWLSYSWSHICLSMLARGHYVVDSVAHHTCRRERTNRTRLLGVRSLARIRARAQLSGPAGLINIPLLPPPGGREAAGDFCTLFTCRPSSPDSGARRSARCSLPQIKGLLGLVQCAKRK